jgi:hypothetical protein
LEILLFFLALLSARQLPLLSISLFFYFFFIQLPLFSDGKKKKKKRREGEDRRRKREGEEKKKKKIREYLTFFPAGFQILVFYLLDGSGFLKIFWI